MAKKPKNEKTMAEQIEQKIRDAINNHPGYMDLGEKEALEVALQAMGCIREEMEARLPEIEDDDE